MVRRIKEDKLQPIEAVVGAHPEGIGIADIEEALDDDIPRRTLQYRLKHLVDAGRLVSEGTRRWQIYRPAWASREVAIDGAGQDTGEAALPVSESAARPRDYVRRPLEARKPVGYSRRFLNDYRPNVTAWLSEKERQHLREIGTPTSQDQPAGTYATQILNRLLIDLSWNSSRLEGNTYSLLDTRRLIAFGEAAQGKQRLETQMILNHKDAIEFLVDSAGEIGFNRHTILNLHALLANNLLGDPAAAGRLRRIPVGIEKSVYHPLEVPQLIEECFDQILATAEAIGDPFEQSFFVMVQLPYLQPFDDVNKRVSRLAANIGLVQGNFMPLSFNDVPVQTYTEAILAIYELNEIDLLKDVFIWAYERSASRYAAVRQSLGEPDPFRLKHRDALRAVVRAIVLEKMGRKKALAHIADRADKHIEDSERETFREVAEDELLGLHEGNFARYQVTPDAFRAWQEVWGTG